MNMQTMDIPLNVEVKCCGRNCGRSTHIVLNPVTKEITHLVVKERAFPHIERLVAVDFVVESTARMIRLRCDAPGLDQMDEFVETEFIPSPETFVDGGPFMMWPYAYTTEEYIPQSHERIPTGELAVRRGARVMARDGQIGQVDEFIVTRHGDHITHLVMREGHLWEQHEVTIPVSYIARIEDDAVYLNLDKESVAVLPNVPVHRG